MKFRRILILLLAVAGFACACGDDVRVDLDIKDADSYCTVYVAQACNSPVEKTFTREDTSIELPVNIFLGGPKTAWEQITAEFELDNSLVSSYNELTGKTYLQIPSEACTVEAASAVIEVGENSSSPVKVTVDPGMLKGNKQYLLPVAMKTCSFEQVADNLSVAYYVITIEEEIPQDPRVLVLDFGHKVNGRIACAYSDLLFRDDDDSSNLHLYARDADGNFVYESQIGAGWNVGGLLDPLIFIPPYTICFRLNDTFQEFSFFDRYTGWLGAMISFAGWTDMKFIFNYKDITFLAVSGDALNYYDIKRTDDFDANHWVIINEEEGHCGTIASSGWGSDKFWFCHKNYIVTVDSAGNMYKWPFSDDKVLGEPIFVSEGWGDYEQVISCNDEYILALDARGKLYRMPDEL